MISKNLRVNPSLGIVFIFTLILTDFTVTSWNFLQTNRHSGAYQGEILKAALDVKEGAYRYDGNQNPTYFTVLSFLAGRTPAFFTKAKLLSLLTLLLTLILFFLICKDLFGIPSALLSLCLLGSNWVALALSFHLRAEVLLLGCFLAAWYASVKGFMKGGGWWAAAGILTGLTYLVKSTGQLFVVAVLLSFVLVYRKRWGEYRWLGLFLLTYSLVASPLLFLNFKTFGDPFYNWSIRHAMWLESWWNLDQLQHVPSGLSYIMDKGVLEVASREGKGIFSFFPVFVSIFKPHQLFFVQKFLFWPWVGGLLFGTFLWLKKKKFKLNKIPIKFRGPLLLSCIYSGLLFLLFSWYQQISSSERFVLVLIPVFFCFLGHWTVVLYKVFKNRFKRTFFYGPPVLVGMILISAIVKFSIFDYKNLFQNDRPDPWVNKALSFVEKASPNKGVAVTSEESLPLWLLKEPRASVYNLPYGQTKQEWISYLKEKKINWVLISDPDYVAKSDFLRNYFKMDNTGVLGMTRFPPNTRKEKITFGPGIHLLRVVR